MKGPMVPIKFFREVIFPCLSKQVEASRRRGIKFIKHTDGNVLPLMEYLADIVDGVHSLDPSVKSRDAALDHQPEVFVLVS